MVREIRSGVMAGKKSEELDSSKDTRCTALHRLHEIKSGVKTGKIQKRYDHRKIPDIEICRIFLKLDVGPGNIQKS